MCGSFRFFLHQELHESLVFDDLGPRPSGSMVDLEFSDYSL